MITLTTVLLSLLGFFILILTLRTLFGLKLCALCGATTLTWLGLLYIYFSGGKVDKTLIAILMGGSAVGLMYFLEGKLPESYEIFKLPYYSSAVVIIYLLLRGMLLTESIIIVVTLWALFLFLFFLHRGEIFHEQIRKVIECCRNW